MKILQTKLTLIGMTNITFYGGINEIGGNQILLEEGDTRIWLDFGLPFSRAGEYFAEFLQPRKCGGVGDLLEFGLIPDLKGLYRRDYLERHRKPSPRAYDAVFLSHAHADHSAYIHFLRQTIPIYASEITRQILEALETTSSMEFAEFLTMKETFKIVDKKRGEGKKRLQGKDAEIPRNFKVLDGKVSIGDGEVEPLRVNHSLPGALAYLVHLPYTTLVYTGDFRFHGYGGELTRDFVSRAADSEPDVMLCEGTNIKEEETISEPKLEGLVTREMRSVDGLVVVNFPVRDTDRMKSFLEAARENDRELVVNMRQAYMLKLLEETQCNAPALDDVQIFLPRKGWGLIDDPSYPKRIVEQDYDRWEHEFLDRENTVTPKDLRYDPKRYVFRCDFFELKNLIDIRPPEGSIYIRSVTEPFDEEMMIDKQKADRWLKHFGLWPYKHIHCSGHTSGSELQKVVEEISPEILVPIHTDTPEKFREFHRNTIMVGRGERISIGDLTK